VCAIDRNTPCDPRAFAPPGPRRGLSCLLLAITILDHSISRPADGVFTVYPYPSRNLTPTVLDWKAEPCFLKTPASRVRLSAATQNPELDRLSYSWSVTRQPAGARATLADRQAAATEAGGLTVPGHCTFTVAIRDGVNEVKRDVRLRVYAANQPPVLIDVHNRLPVQVMLPDSPTVLRGGALDLEGDQLTFRWRVVSEPPGATARLETPESANCRVSNFTRPGGPRLSV
jgi:hypothetical protein